MSLILAITLTISAGVWRFIDGRGYGPTWARNVAGLIIASLASFSGILLGDHKLSFGPEVYLTWATCKNFLLVGSVALLAWATLILGYTNWPSWWSLARYGLPTFIIARIITPLGPGSPELMAYVAGGFAVGLVYVLLHRSGWKYATATSEVIAGVVIVGGLAWLG